ncbi:MAG: class I SAM-dependent methyltransferase [Limisphaerales bacterium]
MRDLVKQSFALVGVIKALRQIPFDVRRALWCIGREGDIREYLESHPVRKLQIGAGYNMLAGWLNVDFNPYTRQPGQLYLNATRTFPFAEASFDYVFSEHMIEHIWWPDGQTMLKESHRILKPGGKIRISTPNLASITSLLDPPRTAIKEQYLKLARSQRDALMRTIYEALKAYRLAVPARLPNNAPLLETLPKLTPDPGHTPDAVNASAVFVAPDQFRVVYDASTDADLKEYQLRGNAGGTFKSEDAVVIATNGPSATREFLSGFALTQPGAKVSVAVYVVTNAGNERASAPMTITRPNP